MKGSSTTFALSWPLLLTFLLAAALAQNETLPDPTANQTIKELAQENIAAAKDVAAALKQKSKENQKLVADAVNTMEAQLKEAAHAVDTAFPQLEVSSNPYLLQLFALIRDYKELVILIGGGLVTAFQMIFGGGVSYLTSKMKNLSDHKIKIQQGFDLQFYLYQKQELSPPKPIIVSPTFRKLFDFLDLKDNKEIKLILGSSGVGFSSNVKEWLRQKQEKNNHCKYLLYDVGEQVIRTNANEEATHLSNISSIVYSLLYRADRNFVLSLFKNLLEVLSSFFSKLWHLVDDNRYETAAFIILFYYLPQICYYIVLFFISKTLILPALTTVAFILWRILGTTEKILLKSERENTGETVRIIVDNFQMLMGEFQARHKEKQLKNPSASPLSPQKLEQVFLSELTKLFNNILTLQDKSGESVEVIIIVKNSEFYKQYIDVLTLNTANAFKIKKLTQLPVQDIVHTIEQRTLKTVPVKGKEPVKGATLTSVLALFHNNSKEIMKILREVNLDEKYKSAKKEELQEEEYLGRVLNSSMAQVVTHAQRLNQLLEIEPSEESPLRFVGLFLGCLHKKLIFFANRKDLLPNSTLEEQYAKLLKCLNPERRSTNPDRLPSISSSNRHYIFEKKNSVFAFKNEVKLILFKWDELINYIEGDNDWAESLRDDFVYYYIENRKSLAAAKTNDHRKYHLVYLQEQDMPSEKRKEWEKIKEGDAENLNADLLLNKGKQIFAQVVDFLTEKEVITNHIFFSRSVALANYYLQERVKERQLYERFQMKKCKLAQEIEEMGRPQAKLPYFTEQIAKFMDTLREKFETYVSHEAKSYEQGMSWLKHYFHESVDCNLSESTCHQFSNYLLQRTNDSYILRPYINDALLYWDSFEPRVEENFILQFTNTISKEPTERKIYLERFRSKTIFCAYWYYKCVEKEKEVTKNLLGFQFGQLLPLVKSLEKVSATRAKQKFIYRDQKWEDLAQLLKQNCGIIRTLFRERARSEYEKSDPSELKLRFHEYEALLKLYRPDGLFKDININYRKAFYIYNGRQYFLNPEFKDLVIITKYLDKPLNLPSPKDLAQRLANPTATCAEIFQHLTPQDWQLLLLEGQGVKQALRELPKGRDSEFREALLFTDLKSLLATFSFSIDTTLPSNKYEDVLPKKDLHRYLSKANTGID